MCEGCRWLDVVAAIEVNLVDRETDHTGFILATASRIIQANEHVTEDQSDAIQAIREREGWVL